MKNFFNFNQLYTKSAYIYNCVENKSSNLEKIFIQYNSIISFLKKNNFKKNKKFFLKLNIFTLSLKLFLIKNISYNKLNFFSKKNLYLDIGLFVSNSGISIQNYRFNKNITFLNKNIYFFNINKLVFVLNQFSSFLFKIVNLRGNVFIISFNKNDSNFIQSCFSSLGINYLIGNWINGFFTNWLYFYRRLWNLEDNLLQEVNTNLKIVRKFSGLIGLKNIPDFIFILNTGNGLSVQNLLIESFKYSVPVSSVINLNDDPRYLVFPLFGDMSNGLVLKFYQLIFLNIYKRALISRVLNNCF